jgi:hypothetical protein
VGAVVENFLTVVRVLPMTKPARCYLIRRFAEAHSTLPDALHLPDAPSLGQREPGSTTRRDFKGLYTDAAIDVRLRHGQPCRHGQTGKEPNLCLGRCRTSSTARYHQDL